MFHIIHGKLKKHGDEFYIENDIFGVSVEYIGKKKKGSRYLHPIIDTNRNTIKYYAFDHHKQKELFLEVLKIPGIGGKNGYVISSHNEKELRKAVQDFDVGYFTSLSGIGPKTAKRILLELKSNIGKDDVKKLSIDKGLLKNILTSLHDLGYERKHVKEQLAKCTIPLKKDNLPEIMKRLVDHL